MLWRGQRQSENIEDRRGMSRGGMAIGGGLGGIVLLVIALLMDGPQLASRWPARYATVLADDPGSSVLTLTSVGMAELSRPPNVQATSRAVALWKDAKSGEAVSIELPPSMEGVILSLSRKLVMEYAADGRDDGGTTGYPTLSGIHFVRSNP